MVIPKVGDLCVGWEKKLCYITGFGKVRHCGNNNYAVILSLKWGNSNYCNFAWNFENNHLVMNNKGVWEISVKEGQDPLFIEWMKQNEEVQ